MLKASDNSLKYDNIKVHSEQELSENDLVNLRRLYSPIIGSVVVSLYSYLYDSLKIQKNH